MKSRNLKIVLLVLLAIIFVAEAVLAAVYVAHRSKDHGSTAAGNNTQAVMAAKDACAIFTLADAKQLLGGAAAGGAQAATGSSRDLKVSGCSYKSDNGAAAAAMPVRTASLLMRQPKTAAGTAGNQRAFGALRPPGAQTVSGYGDKAYWDGQLGQLNILKKNVWYVLAYGDAAPSNRSLDQTRRLADTLADKL